MQFSEQYKYAQRDIERSVVTEFLDWLDGQGIVLARHDEDWDALLPDYTLRERLIATYLGVNYDQLLVERARIHVSVLTETAGEEVSGWNRTDLSADQAA